MIVVKRSDPMAPSTLAASSKRGEAHIAETPGSGPSRFGHRPLGHG
jgi:hypothetical protein